MLKRELARLQRELIVCGAYILGAGAVALTEYLVARLESLHMIAYRLNLPCDVESWYTVFWFEQSRNQTYRQGSASHGEAVANVKARCVNTHQHLFLTSSRLVDVFEL